VPATDLTFRILGPIDAVDADGRALDLGGPKQRAVLAVLLLEAGRVVATSRIIEALWGDEPPASAQGTLQAYVSNLRRALGPARAGLLVTQAPGYRLDAPPEAIDAVAFTAATAEAAAALDDGRIDDALTTVEAALARWRGPALGEVTYEAFAASEVRRLDELRLQATEVRAEALLAAGRHTEVAAELGATVAEHPLRGRLRRALMLALYRSGRQAEALRTYAEGRTVLRDELGAEPEPELQALEEQILLQDPALDWHPAGGASPTTAVSLGEGEGVGDGERGGPVLVGRDAELAVLERLLISSASGRGGVALVSGEAGIGKTRLAEAVAERAVARQGRVAWGRSFESQGAPAFWPWVEAMRGALATVPEPDLGALLDGLGPDAGLLVRLLPELAAHLPAAPPSTDGDGAGADDALRFSLYDAVARLLTAIAAVRPTVVVLDDLHWADPSTLRLLRYVTPALATTRLLIVATFRDDEVAGELAETLAALAREAHVERIEVRGLTEGDVGRVLAETLDATPADDVIRDIAERSAGNPFFVGELARLLVDGEGRAAGVAPVPPGVREVIQRRIERLPEGAADLLAAAAVAGREFDLRVAAEVAGLDPDGDDALDLADAAVAAHLIGEGSRIGRYRFAHALVQDALAGALSSPRRARLHRRIAAVLAAAPSSGRPEDLAELAFHALEGATADDAGAAVDHALAAIDAALGALSFEDAAALAAGALALADRTGVIDDERRYALHVRLGVARRRQGDLVGARAALTEALALARAQADDDAGRRFATAALHFSGGAWWGWWSEVGTVDDAAIGALEEALERLPDGADVSSLRAEVLGRLAVELHFAEGDERRRDDLSAEALRLARATGGRDLTHALAARHLAVWRSGNAGERRVIADELVATARSARVPELEAYGHHFLLLAAVERGDAAAAGAQLDEGERLVRTLPLPHLVAQVAWSRSMLAAVAGRFDDAERLQGEALATTSRWSEAESFRTWSAQLVGLRWEQGRGIELAQPLRDLVDRETISGNWKAALALVLADGGELDEAREVMDDVAAAAFTDVPVDLSHLFNLTVRAVAVALLEDGARAAQLLRLLEPFVGGHVVLPTRVVYAGPVSFHVACLRLVAGDLDGGRALLDQSLAEADRIGSPSFRARTLLAMARAEAARRGPGARAAVERLAGEAQALATSVGMRRVAARAEAARA
jgi:DNA-binding SARP family transcriptional activator